MRTTASGTPAHTPESPRFTPGPLHILDFPSKSVRVYAIAPEARLLDVQMLFEARIAQLESMLMVTYGEGGESFRSLHDDLQEGFMWACSYLASEVRALYEVMRQMQKDGGAK